MGKANSLVHPLAMQWAMTTKILGIAAVMIVLLVVLCFAADDTAPECLPVLLAYGFQPIPGYYPPQLWPEFAEGLSGTEIGTASKILLEPGHVMYMVEAASDEDRTVYISDYAVPYEPTVRDLRFYASRLDDEIAWIIEQRDVEQVDVIGHSMGGLVARAYIEAADFDPLLGSSDFPDYETVYRGDVRILITLATPHHGAAFGVLGPWFGPLPQQLAVGSRFLQALNRMEGSGVATALDPGVRYVSMAGQSCLGFGCSIRGDADACRRECVHEALLWEGHDLIIKMASAYLPGAENVACIGMDHADMHLHDALIEPIRDILRGEPAPEALYGTAELRRAGEGEP